MDEKINALRDELKQEMNNLSKQILDRQFLFESEYGKKIDVMYNYVQFHQEFQHIRILNRKQQNN